MYIFLIYVIYKQMEMTLNFIGTLFCSFVEQIISTSLIYEILRDNNIRSFIDM